MSCGGKIGIWTLARSSPVLAADRKSAAEALTAAADTVALARCTFPRDAIVLSECLPPSHDSCFRGQILKKSCPSVQCPCSHTHVDEGLVGEVKELVELDSTVGVLLERTRGLLGGSLLAGSELSLRELAALNCSSAVGFVL